MIGAKYRKALAARVARQQAFHQRREPGDLLVFVNRGRYTSLESLLCRELAAAAPELLRRPARVRSLVHQYVRDLRQCYEGLLAIPDDAVPCALVYWGIGGITGTMTGLDPVHDGTTSWLEPSLAWEQIAGLRFTPDNRWVQFALHVNQALWHEWQEDFFILPFLHRSPLDAANGIRGTALWWELLTAPDQVETLLNWCVDWQLALERFLADHDGRAANGGVGVWDTWLPAGAVFVNGDPVDLISRELQPRFDRCHTGRLFTASGGGFFHHHTLGLHQVDLVAQTPGLLVQEFVADPKVPNLPAVLLTDPVRRDRIVQASLRAPVMIEEITPEQLPALLPILRQGRFLVCVRTADPAQAAAAARQVRLASNLA